MNKYQQQLEQLVFQEPDDNHMQNLEETNQILENISNKIDTIFTNN